MPTNTILRITQLVLSLLVLITDGGLYRILSFFMNHKELWRNPDYFVLHKFLCIAQWSQLFLFQR